MKGRRVSTLDGLWRLALRKKAVLLPGNPNPRPAAFVMSMHARDVMFMLHKGIFEYRKESK